MNDAVIQRLYRRITAMVGRGRIRTSDDTGSAQMVQVDLGPKGDSGPLMIRDKTPVVGLFGLASHAPANADAILLFLAGGRDKAVVIGHGHQASRLKNLGEGDSALYDVRGAYVWLTPNGLVIDAATKHVTIQNADQVTITASTGVTINADVTVNGKITATGDIKAGSISLETHVHGGVTTGAGNTAAPH